MALSRPNQVAALTGTASRWRDELEEELALHDLAEGKVGLLAELLRRPIAARSTGGARWRGWRGSSALSHQKCKRSEERKEERKKIKERKEEEEESGGEGFGGAAYRWRHRMV
ncbi:hypothetical protein JCGZ_03449 [Jatropha curcas]|uniref:Uncharacterized protein n=1 Tax=Jatropha curcas TaxID=180498 RepID=A0A067KY56_JATCU|nr:hypothetical protein JCGZ_03449 [Jatropha curcas]